MSTNTYLVRKFAADERPYGIYRATFQGMGTFPFDMLRYDDCWPESPDDALNIGVTPVNRRYRERRRVTVVAHNDFAIERWMSFGWAPVPR